MLVFAVKKSWLIINDEQDKKIGLTTILQLR